MGSRTFDLKISNISSFNQIQKKARPRMSLSKPVDSAFIEGLLMKEKRYKSIELEPTFVNGMTQFISYFQISCVGSTREYDYGDKYIYKQLESDKIMLACDIEVSKMYEEVLRNQYPIFKKIFAKDQKLHDLEETT